jgi:hypothetical protein
MLPTQVRLSVDEQAARETAGNCLRTVKSVMRLANASRLTP